MYILVDNFSRNLNHNIFFVCVIDEICKKNNKIKRQFSILLLLYIYICILFLEI